jgi:hypothetical protein
MKRKIPPVKVDDFWERKSLVVKLGDDGWELASTPLKLGEWYLGPVTVSAVDHFIDRARNGSNAKAVCGPRMQSGAIERTAIIRCIAPLL